MTEKSVAEKKYEDWIFMVAHAAGNLPKWYNPRTRRSELTAESTERLRGMVDDTKQMINPYYMELVEQASQISFC